MKWIDCRNSRLALMAPRKQVFPEATVVKDRDVKVTPIDNPSSRYKLTGTYKRICYQCEEPLLHHALPHELPLAIGIESFKYTTRSTIRQSFQPACSSEHQVRARGRREQKKRMVELKVLQV